MNSVNGNSLRTVGDRIRWAIEEKLGISQAEFADRLDVKRQQLNRWINDPNKPPGQRWLSRIAEESGVPEAWLKYGDEALGVARETATDAAEVPQKTNAATLQQKAAAFDLVASLIRGLGSTSGGQSDDDLARALAKRWLEELEQLPPSPPEEGDSQQPPSSNSGH